ncbi:nucleoside/nucleotide kinase family protein [Oceanobacillus kimchii]|uniref:uridine kinase n=1 Tax=Oceanobacillus kimchii TaxID=746691 RepID=UPI00098769A9|nr:uridine kinase [Oceanobacillus kimchii]
MEKPFIIAISSVSGGGKTTISKALQEELDQSKVIHFDQYDIPSPDDFSNWIENSANYNDWDLHKIDEEIQELYKQNWKYIILDYPFLYENQQLVDKIDIAFYINTPLDIAMARRILRDIYDISVLRNDLQIYLENGRKAYLQMEKVIQPHADYVISGQQPVSNIVSEIVKRIY